MELTDVKQTSGLVYIYPLVPTSLKEILHLCMQGLLNLFWRDVHSWRLV